MSRLFLCVRPPTEVLASLAEALEQLHGGAPPQFRWLSEQQWHVTLRFFGQAGEADVSDALEGFDLPGCTARLHPVPRVLGRALVCDVDGLDELASALCERTHSVGEPPDPRGFQGHLTVGRPRGKSNLRWLPDVSGTPTAALDWNPARVDLVSSVTDPGGAIHEVVAHYPIG